MTLFPDTVSSVLHESILGRAAKKGLIEINCVQIRDYTENRQCQVDDYPYGGGWGCVMMAQPLKSCLDDIMKNVHAASEGGREVSSRVIYLSPQGKPFTQETAKRLKKDYDHLVLVCGHYEGIDERFIEACVDEEISLGDFVLTGGEIAAMAVADAVCRLVPGVLSDEQCYIGESHWDGLLEYPQYTRPEVWEGREVPEVLRGGDHAKIEHWRRKQQFIRTREKRPDLFEAFLPEDREDQKILREIERDASRLKLTEPVSCRKAEEPDFDAVLQITQDARKHLAAGRIDQWQGEYPDADQLRQSIVRGECYILLHGEEAAGYFVLSAEKYPDYDSIRDGKWTGDDGVFCLILAAVAAKYRGSGISRYLIRNSERIALEQDGRYIRTDIHKKNKAMQALLASAGFRYRGNLTVSAGQGHDPSRQAFEKHLK